MHTLKVIFGGFLFLGVCLLLGRWIGGAAATVVATTIKYFLVLWLVATLVNIWVGVSKAGYSRRRLAAHPRRTRSPHPEVIITSELRARCFIHTSVAGSRSTAP